MFFCTQGEKFLPGLNPSLGLRVELERSEDPHHPHHPHLTLGKLRWWEMVGGEQVLRLPLPRMPARPGG